MVDMTDTRTDAIRCDPLDLLAEEYRERAAADPLDAAIAKLIAKLEEKLVVLRRARELQRRIMGEGE